MSNQLVGSIYQRIIHDVIQNSHVDFEEGGVDQQTLDELRTVWQQKLSSLGVAQFPWDPAPPLSIVNTPTVPSNAAKPQQPPQPPQHQQPPQLPQLSQESASLQSPGTLSNGASPVRIKTEPGYENSLPGLPHANAGQSPATANAQIAQQRAAALIQQKYGPQASPQVAQLQAGISLPGQQRPQGLQMPVAQTKEQLRQQNHQLQQAQRANLESAHFDGAGDTPDDGWNAVVVRRGADGKDEEMGRVHADRTIRAQIEQLGQRMEGGGLMIPLEERPRTNKRKNGKPVVPGPAVSLPTEDPSPTHKILLRAQYDGVDESDEDDKVGIKHDSDEDAINSDLDDPNDNVGEEEEDDEGAGQIMLCTYDKVQRVKNKWKCTLKDGILTTNGKEYVFYKAQGEFEW